MRPALLNALRTALLIIVVIAVAMLLLLPADQHDWMRQMDPTIQPGDIQDTSHNGGLVAGIIAAVGGSAALLIGVIARKTTGRLLAIGAAMVIATVWFVRFAG